MHFQLQATAITPSFILSSNPLDSSPLNRAEVASLTCVCESSYGPCLSFCMSSMMSIAIALKPWSLPRQPSTAPVDMYCALSTSEEFAERTTMRPLNPRFRNSIAMSVPRTVWKRKHTEHSSHAYCEHKTHRKTHRVSGQINILVQNDNIWRFSVRNRRSRQREESVNVTNRFRAYDER
jgi:hypothetical protein